MLNIPVYKKIFVLFVVLFGLTYALPNFVESEYLPNKKINLGLDLQGGSHLVLKVELADLVARNVENLADDVRRELRDSEKGRLTVRNFKEVRGGVRFNATTEDVALLAVERLKRSVRDAEITRNDLSVTVNYTNDAILQMERNALSQTLEILRNRVDEFGVAEPVIQREGTDRIIIELPGVDDPARAKSVIGRTAQLSFHLVVDGVDASQYVERRPPAGTKLLYMQEKQGDQVYNRPILVERRAALTGERLAGASAGYSSQDNAPSIFIDFDRSGSLKFGQVTSKNVGRRLAIILDDIVYSAPNLNEPILGGSAIINGDFSVQETEDLATVLRAGALPAPVAIVEERTIGPSLGADSIAAGKMAIMVGFLFILVVMFAFYRGFGLAANVALVCNVILILGIMTLLGATLTLPGIAGIVLTMGMAVDANVLIFERIREESKKAKSVSGAIDNGFKGAFSTIMDANVTTLIAAVVLFAIGSGPIKGFALTLSVGIATSMFSAIMITRILVVTWLNKAKPTTLKG